MKIIGIISIVFILLLKVSGKNNDYDNKVFAPLIPSYRVYTKLSKTYFRFEYIMMW